MIELTSDSNTRDGI